MQNNELMKARIAETALAVAGYKAQAERAIRRQWLLSAQAEAAKVAYRSKDHAALSALIDALVAEAV